MQRILGNSYGQLIYESMLKYDESSVDVFRFCHRDHQHPEYPKLITGDVNGELLNFSTKNGYSQKHEATFVVDLKFHKNTHYFEKHN